MVLVWGIVTIPVSKQDATRLKKNNVFVICTWGVYFSSVRYDFRIKTMFGSSLPPVVCRKTHVLFTLFVFVCVQRCLTHILCCVFVLLFFVLCDLCCQFLRIVHSLTFIWQVFFKNNSGEMYSIQQYAIKFVEDLWQVGDFLSNNKTDRHNIAEILLKVELISTTLTTILLESKNE